MIKKFHALWLETRQVLRRVQWPPLDTTDHKGSARRLKEVPRVCDTAYRLPYSMTAPRMIHLAKKQSGESGMIGDEEKDTVTDLATSSPSSWITSYNLFREQLISSAVSSRVPWWFRYRIVVVIFEVMSTCSSFWSLCIRSIVIWGFWSFGCSNLLSHINVGRPDKRS